MENLILFLTKILNYIEHPASKRQWIRTHGIQYFEFTNPQTKHILTITYYANNKIEIIPNYSYTNYINIPAKEKRNIYTIKHQNIIKYLIDIYKQ